MKDNRFLPVRFAPVFLFLTIAVPLLAQQQESPIGQRVAPRQHAVNQVAALPAQSLELRCREFLLPPKVKETADPVARWARRVEAEDKLKIRLAADSDSDLAAAEDQLMECVTGLPSRRLRREALDAYILAKEEQNLREQVEWNAYWSDQLDKQKAEHAAAIEKQHADFLEAAKFAAALYKENEQRKEENLTLVAVFNEESRRYRNLYDAVQQAINIAGQLLNGSRRASLPVFADVQVPQVIRIETPAVPRALHCSANTTPNLSMSSVVSTSTTWINCW